MGAGGALPVTPVGSDPATSPGVSPWGPFALMGVPRRGRLARALAGEWMSPARLLLLSFASLIAVGTVGLATIPGLYVGERLGWLDALFTATSAVCVTGLIVVDTATRFTLLGQAYLLVMIQLGGLGILTFTTLVILAMGRRVSLRQRAAVGQGPEEVADLEFRDVLRSVVLFTFTFEAVGALCLWGAWTPALGVGGALWAGIFHSVSAFCNAGFSVFSHSLAGSAGSPLVLAVVMLLVVAGGIGFLTLIELRAHMARAGEGRRRRLSLHTRLVLVTTGVLLGAGWAAFAALEWNGVLASLGPVDRIGNALFMSVTARTAGFNTVDYAAVSPPTTLITMLLMAVGGSPGSTAGGMKTTTFAVLVLAALARLRGRHEVSVGGRALPDDAVRRALALWVAGSVLVAGTVLLLATVEMGAAGAPASAGDPFLFLLFEAVSAFNTVGLSMGATSELSGVGKGAVILLMYLGRVGPMAAAAALVPPGNGRRDLVRHAREDVIIG